MEALRGGWICEQKRLSHVSPNTDVQQCLQRVEAVIIWNEETRWHLITIRKMISLDIEKEKSRSLYSRENG
jgi:uncharacterized protein YheU (UPF0270 family)